MTASFLVRNSPSSTALKRVTAVGQVPENKGDTKNHVFVGASPSATTKKDRSPSPTSKYGYGDAAPDDKSKYGYEDAAPSTASASHPVRTESRRSSMKSSGAPSRRRASIHMGEEIEVSLPGRHEPVRRRTSISFDQKVRVKPVVPVPEMVGNPEALWFQDDEFHRIKEKTYQIVDSELLSQQFGGKKAHKYCTRGLERMINAREVKQKKYACWDSVLGEQDLQRKEGTFNEEYMANIYKYTTASSQTEAQKRAQADEAEIQTYMKETRRYMRRLSMQ